MSKLILLRHGASVWNEQNLFTGWVDVPLSTKGREESLAAGKKIALIPFDVIFTSSLLRAQETAVLAMSVHESQKTAVLLHPEEKWATIHSKETESKCLPMIAAWQLNERMYGVLQGMNKEEMRRKYGEEQVHIWRRSFSAAPPEGESLQMTAERAIPYFKESVVPYLEQGKNVLISAHGNSLRAIVMHLDNLSHEQVVQLEIPTGGPLFYTYANGRMGKDA